MEEIKIHTFEAHGLGKAPFSVVGYYSIPSASLGEHNPTAYNNALAAMPPEFGCGICAFCGAALVHNCLIKSADGKTFSVGSDCVLKTGDMGMIDMEKFYKKKAAREASDKARKSENDARLEKEREENGG